MFYSRCVRISAEYMAMILETSHTIIVQIRLCAILDVLLLILSNKSMQGQEDKTMSEQFGKKLQTLSE